ncbi:hypothetical protein [Escherichia coli]|uniref:hypothetical protein n=1 Tax=Escherichia coli TaxID=562 RepID=UPI001FCEF02A|nr:hypothetical protein [Escherichia coli]
MACLLNKSDMASSIGISVQAFDKWGVPPVERRGREVFYDVKTVLEIDRERRQHNQRAPDKGKAPLDSPAFTGMPTTPTPSQDASGCEIVNAEFVRALIAATSSGSYSTDSVVPLVINGAQLQSAHQSSGPLVINKVQFQHVRQTRTNAPLVVNKALIQSAHQSSGPLVINKAQLQHGRQARTNGPLVVNRMGLSFAFVTPLQ